MVSYRNPGRLNRESRRAKAARMDVSAWAGVAGAGAAGFPAFADACGLSAGVCGLSADICGLVAKACGLSCLGRRVSSRQQPRKTGYFMFFAKPGGNFGK